MDQPPVGSSEDKRHVCVEGFASHINRTAATMHRVRSQSGAHSWRTRPERPLFPPPALALLVWCTGRPHPWCSAEKKTGTIQQAERCQGCTTLYVLLPLYELGGKFRGYFRPRASSGLSPSDKSPVNHGGVTLGLLVDFIFHFCISSQQF